MNVTSFVKNIILSFLIISSFAYSANALAAPAYSPNTVTLQINTLVTQLQLLQKKLAELRQAEGKVIPTSFAYKTTFYSGSYESIYVTDGSALIAQSNKIIRTGDQLVWNTFVNLVGRKFVDKHVSEFRVYNDKNSDVSAFVEEKPDGSWILAVNREGATLSDIYNKKPMTDLLLHEYAHIVFFNDDGDIERDFKNTFWKGVSSRTYNTKEFVTEYAATNAQEDMIESFVYFVTSNKPADTLKRSNKIRFFYDYPELVTLRASLQKSDLI